MKFKFNFVLITGCVVLVAVCVMLFSAAYLRSGHPPASGIINLLLLVTISPFSIVAAFLGMTTPQDTVFRAKKWYFVMTGVSLCFAVFTFLLLFLKMVLGKTI